MIGKYIGIPYKEHGKTFKEIDCLGLVYMFYKNELNIDLDEYQDLYKYTDVKDFDKLDSHITKCKEHFKLVQKPMFGDIILMRIGKFSCHLGIYLNESTFLHAEEGKYSAVERLDSTQWKHRVVGIYRPCSIS